MGDYTLNTVKGHGFAVGDQVEFYGMGNSEFGPKNEPSLCVLTKMGNKYVLTHAATVKGDTITWEFGPAAKIWASKVETVAVSPVALGQTVHNVESDEVFTVAEVTPRSVSLRKIGTWRDGVTVPMVDIADMINMGTMVIIGNPDDRRAEVEIHTGDGTVITTDDVKARFAVAFGDAKKLGKVWSSSGRLIDPVEPIPANPQPFSDRDMRDQIIAYLGSDVDAYYVDGIVDHIIRLQGGAIDINKINPDKFTQVLDMFAKTPDPSEEEVRSGTDTLIKPSIRTGLARRKRKATKKARRMVKGGF